MKTISTENAPAAIGPYSQAQMAWGLVFVSGQIPVVPATGEVAEGGISGQAEQSCKNVAAVLEAAGSSMAKVLKTTCFLADMVDFAAFNAVYEKHFISKPDPNNSSCLSLEIIDTCACPYPQAIRFLDMLAKT